MGYAQTNLNFQLCHMTTAIICVLCVVVPFTSAYPSAQSEVPTYDEFSKRDLSQGDLVESQAPDTQRHSDMGLEMQCKSHPQNCPPEYVLLKRIGLPLQLPLNSYGGKRVADNRVRDISAAIESLKKSWRLLNDGMQDSQMDRFSSRAYDTQGKSLQELRLPRLTLE